MSIFQASFSPVVTFPLRRVRNVRYVAVSRSVLAPSLLSLRFPTIYCTTPCLGNFSLGHGLSNGTWSLNFALVSTGVLLDQLRLHPRR
jgi:hypothetical protein